MNLNNPKLLDLGFLDWDISHHQLFDIEPTELKQADYSTPSVWGMYFVQDLLQGTINDNLLVDIGWYPEADPEGEYKLVILKPEGHSRYDWDTPFVEFKTNSLRELVYKLNAIKGVRLE